MTTTIRVTVDNPGAAAASPTFTGTMILERIRTPANTTYDLDTNTNANTIRVDVGNITVAQDKQQIVHSVRTLVGGAGITLNGASGHPANFRAYDFDVTFAGSTAYDNGYGLIGALRVDGAGTFKGGYQRVTAAAGFTGVAVAIVGAVDIVAGASVGWLCELAYSGDGSTNGSGIVIQGDGTNTWTTGILFDSSSRWNNACIQRNQNAAGSGGGYFLRQFNTASADNFHVDDAGALVNTASITTPYLVVDRTQVASGSIAGATITMHAHASGTSIRGLEIAMAGAAGSTGSQGIFLGGDNSGNAQHHGFLSDTTLKLDTAFIQRQSPAGDTSDWFIFYNSASATMGRLTSAGALTVASTVNCGSITSTGDMQVKAGGLIKSASGGTLQIATGSASDLWIGTNLTAHWVFTGAHLVAGTDNTSDFGASGANRPRNGYFAGTLSFGSHSAIGAEALSGYITITDAAGNSRKLAVVS